MIAMPMSNGPGLKVLGYSMTYGKGYCNICGDRESIVPRLVRYWDPDDGWQAAVLCPACMDNARERGPEPDDYAVHVAEQEHAVLPQADKIDTLAEVLGDDADAIITMSEDMA